MLDIASAISGATAMLGIAKGAIAARDDFKAQQALGDVQTKLLEITTAALALSQTNIALTDEIRLLKDEAHNSQMKARERERYLITELGTGTYAYKSQPAEEGTSEPLHYLCQPCYDKGVKTILRIQNEGGDAISTPRKYMICSASQSHSFQVRS